MGVSLLILGEFVLLFLWFKKVRTKRWVFTYLTLLMIVFFVDFDSLMLGSGTADGISRLFIPVIFFMHFLVVSILLLLIRLVFLFAKVVSNIFEKR